MDSALLSSCRPEGPKVKDYELNNQALYWKDSKQNDHFVKLGGFSIAIQVLDDVPDLLYVKTFAAAIFLGEYLVGKCVNWDKTKFASTDVNLFVGLVYPFIRK